MNFFETLSRIKSELTDCVEPSVEPVSKDSSIAPLYEEPIDIESWVDLHGVDQKGSKQKLFKKRVLILIFSKNFVRFSFWKLRMIRSLLLTNSTQKMVPLEFLYQPLKMKL